MPLVDIRDGLTVSLARPDGPRVSFEVEQHRDGSIPETDRIPAAERPSHRPPPSARPPRLFRRPLSPGHPPVAFPPAADPDAPTNRLGPVTTVSQFPTRGINVLGAADNLAAPVGRTAWIGRAEDCDIVVSDVLASRRHAYLAPTALGTEIRDKHSINGTFVIGIRVGSAVLSDGDVVTIGNIDLTFTGGTLVRRTAAAASAGGLEVNGPWEICNMLLCAGNRRPDRRGNLGRIDVSPEPQHRPSRCRQSRVGRAITLAVPLHLLVPIVGVHPRPSMVIRAAVPKTTVDKHGDSTDDD